MFDSLVITCEHAGNLIPEEYRYLFKDEEEVLFTHKAVDFGALELARELSKATEAPFFHTLTSRLLVEANRSIDSVNLFSRWSKQLPPHEMEKILLHFYSPYRDGVKNTLQQNINDHGKTLHFSVHSFTPVFNNEKRDLDIGLLFDPTRELEVEFCEYFKKEIVNLNDELIVKFNEPYKGTDDGLTTSLRKIFKTNYAGIEIEVNQKYPLCYSENEWKNIQEVIARSLKKLIK